MWLALRELPQLREAVLEGDVSWGAARLVVAHVSPETEEACLESVRGVPLPAELARLGEGLADCSPRELDGRLRAAIAFLQTVDFQVGRILRQVADRRLFTELGFASLALCAGAAREPVERFPSGDVRCA